jgi:hypothetical protein
LLTASYALTAIVFDTPFTPLGKSTERFAPSFPSLKWATAVPTYFATTASSFRWGFSEYAPDEERLILIAIVHGRRNPRVIAAILRDRK